MVQSLLASTLKCKPTALRNGNHVTCLVETKKVSPSDANPPDASLDSKQQNRDVTPSMSIQQLNVRLVRVAGLQPVLAVVQTNKHHDIEALRALVQLHAKQGLLVCPVALRSSDWGILDGLSSELSENDASAATERPLLDILTSTHFEPKAARQWLLGILKSDMAVLDAMEMATKLAEHVRLSVAVEVVREALEILFATHGQPWVEDVALFDRFETHICGDVAFTSHMIYDYLVLQGAAALAHLYHRSTTKSHPVRFNLEPYRRLVARIESHVLDKDSTPAEHRRRGRLKLIATLLPLPVVVVGAIAYLIDIWPETPMATAPPADRCGGITGHYFKGEAFNDEVTSRVDRGIRLSASKSVAKNLPADHFSVRWEGYLFFEEDGRYSICAECDDGCRVHLNDRAIIDDWNVHPANTTCKTVHARKGWYPILVEYFEQGGKSKMRLLRGPDPQHTKLISAKDFCCRD